MVFKTKSQHNQDESKNAFLRVLHFSFLVALFLAETPFLPFFHLCSMDHENCRYGEENAICIGFIVFMLTQQNLNQLVHLGVFRPQQFWKNRWGWGGVGKGSGGRRKEMPWGQRVRVNETSLIKRRVSFLFFFNDWEKVSLIVLGDNKENIVLQRSFL